MRIITGAPAFFDRSAGITIEMAPAPLLPNPPPQYSLTSTMFDASMPSQPASGSPGLGRPHRLDAGSRPDRRRTAAAGDRDRFVRWRPRRFLRPPPRARESARPDTAARW